MPQMLIQLIAVACVIALIYYFSKVSKSEATYVKSDLDNKEYLVQNLPNKEEAAYMLSVIRQRIFLLRDFLKKNINKYPEYAPYIDQFYSRIKNLTLQENAPDGNYTSYTINKGDEIALCLRCKKTGQLHDMNLLMYVVIHELAHVACPEINHTPLFKKIFTFFLQQAADLKIYQPVNYRTHPQEYCGLLINENILRLP